ncbi:MAG: cysteine rich repeat-containing protein [Geminicoccaceae bacterium]
MYKAVAALVAVGWMAMAVPAMAQDARQIARACAGDIERLCRGVPPGEGRIKACMKAHITELSAPCFDTLLSAVASEKEP